MFTLYGYKRRGLIFWKAIFAHRGAPLNSGKSRKKGSKGPYGPPALASNGPALVNLTLRRCQLQQLEGTRPSILPGGTRGRRQEFLAQGVQKFRGSGWSDPQHPDEVTGSAGLPQVLQIDAGWGGVQTRDPLAYCCPWGYTRMEISQ